jgi:hypothetical protein
VFRASKALAELQEWPFRTHQDGFSERPAAAN